MYDDYCVLFIKNEWTPKYLSENQMLINHVTIERFIAVHC